ncbi:hypothetical protein ACS3UN_10185 [Oscillospiraceae bacterium LTW-04]|nr:hypothetical protein RBH76_11935 [Oscillospiraceae bacterium MB24-C1]
MKMKSVREVLGDAAMMIGGLVFAVHMAKALLAKYNLTLFDLWKTLLKMPSDLWNSGDSAFCALGLMVTGLGLAMAGLAFLQIFLEDRGFILKSLFKKMEVKKTS